MSIEGIRDLLNKSRRSILAAKTLLDDGFPDFAASRAYYAMFYSLEALFLLNEKSYSKHSAIISAFGKDYIKTGIFSNKYHRYILEAFDVRNAGDYGVVNSVSDDKSADMLNKAEDFCNTIEDYINTNINT